MIRHSASRFPMIALVLAVPALGLLTFLGFRFFHHAHSVERARVRESESAKAGESHSRLGGRPGQIVLIVDDVGYDANMLEQLTSLPVRLSFAVIPGTPNAGNTATILDRAGFEVLCHVPMEPLGSSPAGRDAILTSMTNEQIRAHTRRMIRSLPQARGVNNHMGSRATGDRRVMTQVMTVLKEEGLYFLDSMTTAHSVGADVARSVGVRTASRHIFLDHEVNDRSIRRQVAALAALSEKQGLAIGIAHPHATTLRVLQDELPRLHSRGFRFVPAALAVN
jgi:polysaccharide deacetylase 2 family uncharacterized protein YibQ